MMVWAHELQQETYKIEGIIQERTLTLRFRGELEIEDPGPLAEYLKALHDAALSEQVSRATLVFEGIKRINGTAVRALIQWILRIRNENAERQYPVQIIGAPDSGPQRTSFQVLRSLSSPDLVRILPN